MDFSSLYSSLTLDDLAGFVEDKQEENLHLDFKVLNDSALKSRDDKRNLACSISGFANASGGMIVWGVDARKSADGVDCAVALKKVENVHLLLGRLNSLTGDAVDPLVDGIQHRAIAYEDGGGFALTLVPESISGPHMAKLGEDRYYKRSGDSFYLMEHYDIADMFGRRKRPQLVVAFRKIGSDAEPAFILTLSNEGRATARAPFVAFDSPGTLQRDPYGVDGNRNEGLALRRFVGGGFPWQYGGSADQSIHPKMSVDIARLSLGIPSRPIPAEDVVVRFMVACDDQQVEEGQLVIPFAYPEGDGA